MRHSPVPHSRIVKAYLDPHAVTTAQQQHQLTPESIRQAWLQDQQDTSSSQESSEDEVDKSRANVRQQPASSQNVHPIHTPVQAHRTPVQSGTVLAGTLWFKLMTFKELADLTIGSHRRSSALHSNGIIVASGSTPADTAGYSPSEDQTIFSSSPSNL